MTSQPGLKQEGISLPFETEESLVMLNAKGRVAEDDDDSNMTSLKTCGSQLRIKETSEGKLCVKVVYCLNYHIHAPIAITEKRFIPTSDSPKLQKQIKT